MKKMQCKKCGHGITWEIDDENWIFTCRGQLMLGARKTKSCRYIGSENVNVMTAKRPMPYNGFIGI